MVPGKFPVRYTIKTTTPTGINTQNIIIEQHKLKIKIFSLKPCFEEFLTILYLSIASPFLFLIKLFRCILFLLCYFLKFNFYLKTIFFRLFKQTKFVLGFLYYKFWIIKII